MIGDLVILARKLQEGCPFGFRNLFRHLLPIIRKLAAVVVGVNAKHQSPFLQVPDSAASFVLEVSFGGIGRIASSSQSGAESAVFGLESSQAGRLLAMSCHVPSKSFQFCELCRGERGWFGSEQRCGFGLAAALLCHLLR